MRQISIRVNAEKETGKLLHDWRYIGYDECNYTYTPEGREQLSRFGKLPDAPYFVRTHFLFCTGNCLGSFKFGSTNVYTEDRDGNPVYDFEYVDRIMDTILETGNKPFVEMGFMPMDLVDRGYLRPSRGIWDDYGHYKDLGWSCPPKDYAKWHAFIHEVCAHLKERYGENEVNGWYFELWNEPDIFYWSGTAAEYCRLFDYTENAFHSVLPDARLAGPAVTGIFPGTNSEAFFRFFLEHCRRGTNYCDSSTGTRLDFITFHTKGGGFPFDLHAKKAVPSVERLVYQVDQGMKIIEEFGYGDLEVVLSEADPDGWAAGGIHDNPNMVFRNTEYYASYVASAFEKIGRLSKKYKTPIRPLSWAFMFPGERCFEGTRTFSTQGIDKPVFNLFRMYSRLGDRSLEFSCDGAKDLEESIRESDVNGTFDTGNYTGEGEDTDISGFAACGEDGIIRILAYSHNNDRDMHEENELSVTVSGLPDGTVRVRHFRIDRDHSNACTVWKALGEPLFPEGDEYAAIKARDGLEELEEASEMGTEGGALRICFRMPAHAVSLIEIG